MVSPHHIGSEPNDARYNRPRSGSGRISSSAPGQCQRLLLATGRADADAGKRHQADRTDDMAESAPQGRYAEIGGAAHISNVDSADRFSTLLLEFLGEGMDEPDAAGSDGYPAKPQCSQVEN